jgi:uncharacterized membrane protein YedE/YeeE
MRRFHVAAFASGLLFSVGLAVAGMTLPSKVLGFLDVSGRWDPSLALVMLGATAVYAALYRFSLRMSAPWLGGRFNQPAARRIEPRLIAGAVIFGIGWGLAGYCPGPALASLGAGTGDVAYFVAAMLAGMALSRLAPARAQRSCAAGETQRSA